MTMTTEPKPAIATALDPDQAAAVLIVLDYLEWGEDGACADDVATALSGMLPDDQYDQCVARWDGWMGRGGPQDREYALAHFETG